MIDERIKELRKREGISQRELSEEIGVPQQTISSWESGRNEPSIFNCIVLADYFDVSLDYLCRGLIE